MNTEHTPVSYGEPWEIRPSLLNEVYADNAEYIGTFGMNEDAARAVVCINALAGITDPAEALDFARNALKAAFEFADEVYDKYHRNMFTEAIAKLSPEKV